jgi:hypothetical protein
VVQIAALAFGPSDRSRANPRETFGRLGITSDLVARLPSSASSDPNSLATSLDGRSHSLFLGVLDCWLHLFPFDFAALVTRADRPIPTCLAHRLSHSFSVPGFHPASSNRFTNKEHTQPLKSLRRRSFPRQNGHCGLKARFTSPEDEAAAPAFPPGRSQRTQGPTTVILSTRNIYTSSRK